MKTPKPKKLYDVHVVEMMLNGKRAGITTQHYSLPFALARSKVQSIGRTRLKFALALPNGTNVTEYLNKQKNRI